MITSASASTYMHYRKNSLDDNIKEETISSVDSIKGTYCSYQDTYIGNDIFYGDVYFDPDYGYYAYNMNCGVDYLDWDFEFTEYTGVDTHGRSVYHNKTAGYFYFRDDVAVTYGQNINSVPF